MNSGAYARPLPPRQYPTDPPSPISPLQAGESDKRLQEKLGAEAAAFAALDPEAAATQMPKMQVG